MAKISLRAYNREIEHLIERGNTEEAIAHCRYILKSYPKHLDTYRLLGKAFLESQRYSEASDILNRILSVQPDDFVAQIGMSIIREDEGNLDAAIFHMERAFEIQPSNAAIQDELRRLYGRRDGMEPPRLRLTHGALVRMYARGDLYRQAIAEARAAIVEDPKRVDLEIILARMYFHAGQKAEATEISSRLVNRLPYCFEANRILADVLPETSRAEDAKVYRQRLVALEPYLGYLAEPAIDVQQVPENAITLDHLEWTPSIDADQQPAWATSLGIQLDEEGEEKPRDWMAPVPSAEVETAEPNSPDQPFSEEPVVFEPSAETAPAEEGLATAQPAEIPDWMHNLGWSISGNPAQEQPPVEMTLEEQTSAAPAEIPEWLRGLAPSEVKSDSTVNEVSSNEDWLSSILPPEPTEVVETPIVEKTNIPPELPSSEKPSDLIGPASEVEPAASSAISEELPEWLKGLSNQSEESLLTDQSQEPLPDWLMETSEPPSDALVEEASVPLEQTTAPTHPLQPAPEQEEIPPVALAAVEPFEELKEAQVEPVAGQPASELAQATMVETPEPLPIEEHSHPEEIAAAGQEIAAPIPAEREPGVKDIQTPEVHPGESTALETTAAVETPLPPTAGQGEIDMDAAFAWLESLAARQGAEAETLLVSPEEHREAPPDWVQEQASETAAVEQKPPVAQSEPPIGLAQEAVVPLEEVQPTEKPAGESLPDWIRGSEEVAAEAKSASELSPEPLLREEPPVGEPTPSPLPAEFGKTTPLPSWLIEQSPTNITEPLATEPGEPSTELLPDWLQAPPEPAVSLQTPSESQETTGLPDWLKNLEAEPAEPLPVQPVVPPQVEAAPVLEEVSSDPEVMITQAQSALGHGQLDYALTVYGSLIQQDQHVEDAIHDLRDALYRYPVDSAIWQTLGDAYIRHNRMQDALDAYTKAEELLK